MDSDSPAGILKRSTSFLGKIISKPEYLVVMIGLVFGVLILTLTPPFQACDEPQHVYSAYRISVGHVFPDREFVRRGSTTPTAGARVPASFLETYSMLKAKDLHNTEEGKADPQAIKDSFGIPLEAGNTKFVASYFQYPPLCYAPQALGIALGHLFGGSPVLLIYLARLFNLLVFLAIAFLAIRTTPVLRWAFLLLFLMPVTLFQASSVSADAMTIGVSFLATAFFFKLAFDPDKTTVTTRDLILLAGIACALSLIKPPYFLFMFGYFLIPWRKFGSKKKFILVFMVLALEIAVLVTPWQLMAARYTTLAKASFFLPGTKLSRILHHPVDFARMLFDTIKTRRFYVTDMIGSIGWYNVPIPDWIPYVVLASIFGAALLDKSRVVVDWARRSLSVLIALAVALSTFVIIHVSWDRLDDKIITLYCGRYLIPTLGFFFLAFYNRRIAYRKGMMFYLAVITVCLLSGIATVVAITSRFY